MLADSETTNYLPPYHGASDLSSANSIQLAVDGDLEVTDQLRRLDTSKAARSNRTDGMTVNKSELSTSALVAELRKDEEFFPILLEYLKYEILVYDYALQIHERQVHSLFQRYGDRYFIN